MAWLTGYSYRKKITITAGTGAGTNYQVPLLVGESSGAVGENFDLESHCEDFPNDIRFADNDETTELAHWLESTTGATPNRLSKFYVKVADSLESNVDIYVYYGKVADSSASNGINTFILFDDFNDASFDTALWTSSIGGGGSVTESGGELAVYQGASDGVATKVSSILTFGTNCAVRKREKTGTRASCTATKSGFLNGTTAANFDSVICGGAVYTYDDTWQLTLTYTTEQESYSVTELDVYHIWEAQRNASTSVIFTKDNAASNTHSTQVPTDLYPIEFAVKTWLSVPSIVKYIDWVCVRKFITPEPAYSSAGSEEAPPTGQFMTTTSKYW